MDRIQNRLQERQQKQSDEFFVQLLNEMARMPRFTLQEYRKTQQVGSTEDSMPAQSDTPRLHT